MHILLSRYLIDCYSEIKIYDKLCFIKEFLVTDSGADILEAVVDRRGSIATGEHISTVGVRIRRHFVEAMFFYRILRRINLCKNNSPMCVPGRSPNLVHVCWLLNQQAR